MLIGATDKRHSEPLKLTQVLLLPPSGHTAHSSLIPVRISSTTERKIFRNSVHTRIQQQLYFLRRLRMLRVGVLMLFYHAAEHGTESQLGLRTQINRLINSLVHTALRVKGLKEHPSLLFEKTIVTQAWK